MKNSKFGKNQSGNLLLEAMLGIALAGAGFLVFYEIEHHLEDRKQFSKVASEMYQQYNVFLTALEQYAQKSNSTQVVTCQELKNGYLAQNFNCNDYLGDTLEGILVQNQTQTPTAYVVGVPSTSSQDMLSSYNVSSVQVLNQALAQSQPEKTLHEFFVINENNYTGYPVTNISQSMSFSTIASYLPQQGLKLNDNSYVITLVDASTLNPSAAPPSCTSSSSILNPPGTWTYSYTSTTSLGSSTTTIVYYCSATEWQPYQYCSYINGTTSISNNGHPFSTTSCSCISGTIDFNYSGNPQYFTITPGIIACGGSSLSFTLYGGGGGSGWDGGWGGNGGMTTGVIQTLYLPSNTLAILVGGGGRSNDFDMDGGGWPGGGNGGGAYGCPQDGSGGAGGGGTFVCEGTECNQDTVLLDAGGGGGGLGLTHINGGDGGGGNETGTGPIQDCIKACNTNVCPSNWSGSCVTIDSYWQEWFFNTIGWNEYYGWWVQANGNWVPVGQGYFGGSVYSALLHSCGIKHVHYHPITSTSSSWIIFTNTNTYYGNTTTYTLPTKSSIKNTTTTYSPSYNTSTFLGITTSSSTVYVPHQHRLHNFTTTYVVNQTPIPTTTSWKPACAQSCTSECYLWGYGSLVVPTYHFMQGQNAQAICPGGAGGGGGGYYGGVAGNFTWSGGGDAGWGGTGYCAPIVQNCGGIVGGANNAGTINGQRGGNGKVIVSWQLY